MFKESVDYYVYIVKLYSYYIPILAAKKRSRQ